MSPAPLKLTLFKKETFFKIINVINKIINNKIINVDYKISFGAMQLLSSGNFVGNI